VAQVVDFEFAVVKQFLLRAPFLPDGLGLLRQACTLAASRFALADHLLNLPLQALLVEKCVARIDEACSMAN